MAIVNVTSLYDYDQMMRDMDALVKRHPDIMKLESLGYTHDGRDIPSITIGRQRKSILLTAGVHGRESVNPAVLMGMAEYYLEYYEHIHPFRHISISMVPMVNPDGHTIAIKGFGAIRSMKLRSLAAKRGIRHLEWKGNARGIDVNRNFPCKTWSKASGTEKPGTENETKAMISFLSKINSIGYIDYHSRGELIYYYRNQMGQTYNTRQKYFAYELGRITGYRLAKPSEETEPDDVGGNTVQFYSEYTGKPAITIETIPDETEFPLPHEMGRELVDKLYTTPFVLYGSCNVHKFGI